MDLQHRPIRHGHRLHNPLAETENGRVSTTTAHRQKRGDYRQPPNFRKDWGPRAPTAVGKVKWDGGDNRQVIF